MFMLSDMLKVGDVITIGNLPREFGDSRIQWRVDEIVDESARVTKITPTFPPMSGWIRPNKFHLASSHSASPVIEV